MFVNAADVSGRLSPAV